MKNFPLRCTRLPAIVLAGILFQTQLASAGGCDLPRFAGARLFAAASGGSQYMATADFNHDGFLDVVTTDAINTVSVLLGNGDGTFQPPVNYSVPQPKSVAAADFNRDGKLDLAIWSNFSTVVMLGNGDGTFKAPIAASSQGGAQAAGDFNGDGIPDLAITGSPAYILLGKGDGTFQPPLFNAAALFAGFGVAAGDFNGDGKLDVIAGSNDGIFVMLGDGQGNLSNPADAGFGANPTQVAVGDFNGDHKLDMVVANAGISGNLSVLIGNGDGSFQAAVSYPTALGASSVVVGDFDGDGKPDIAVGNGSAGNILVFAGNGDGTFRSSVASFSIPGGASYLAAGDFNRDGKLDLAVLGTTGVQIALGNGDGTFHGNLSLPGIFGASGPMAVADLNGDGNLDVVFTASNTTGTAVTLQSGIVLVMLGRGDGTFGAAVTYTIGKMATGVAIGDLNGDGKPDLAVADYGSAGVAVLLGNGDGTFQTAVKYPVVNGSGSVVMGDFNGDGNLDLAVASNSAGANSSGGSAGTVTVLLGEGNGVFRDSLVYGAGVNPLSLAVGDVNGAGQPDLVIPDNLANRVLVLMNNYIPGSSGSACTEVQPLGN